MAGLSPTRSAPRPGPRGPPAAAARAGRQAWVPARPGRPPRAEDRAEGPRRRAPLSAAPSNPHHAGASQGQACAAAQAARGGLTAASGRRRPARTEGPRYARRLRKQA